MFFEISKVVSYMQTRADVISRSFTTFTPVKHFANTAMYR
jgi:hypothetical protein